MTYAYYIRHLKGKVPVNAPTYHGDIEARVPEETAGGVGTWICNVCGYVYDPAKGDPENGVPPGTSFDDLPDQSLEVAVFNGHGNSLGWSDRWFVSLFAGRDGGIGLGYFVRSRPLGCG